MTNINCLKPQHGKPFRLNVANKKTFDAIDKLTTMQNAATLYLFAILDNGGHVPCTQCWKDVALLYQDIGSLMMELSDDGHERKP